MNYSMISNKSELHDVTISNLQDLSKHLKSVGVSLIADKLTVQSDVVGFDIGSYFSKIGGRDSGHICQSSACAIGHFAVMRGYEAKEVGVYVTENTVGEDGFISDGNRMRWADFSDSIIGVASDGRQRIIWNWIFSSHWVRFDNSALGVAARIEYLLEHGIPYEFLAIEISDMDAQHARHIINRYSHIKDALEAECAGG